MTGRKPVSLSLGAVAEPDCRTWCFRLSAAWVVAPTASTYTTQRTPYVGTPAHVHGCRPTADCLGGIARLGILPE